MISEIFKIFFRQIKGLRRKKGTLDVGPLAMLLKLKFQFVGQTDTKTDYDLSLRKFFIGHPPCDLANAIWGLKCLGPYLANVLSKDTLGGQMKRHLALILTMLYQPIMAFGGGKIIRCQVIDATSKRPSSQDAHRNDPRRSTELKRDYLIQLLQQANVDEIRIDYMDMPKIGTWTEPKAKVPVGVWTEATD